MTAVQRELARSEGNVGSFYICTYEILGRDNRVLGEIEVDVVYGISQRVTVGLQETRLKRPGVYTDYQCQHRRCQPGDRSPGLRSPALYPRQPPDRLAGYEHVERDKPQDEVVRALEG